LYQIIPILAANDVTAKDILNWLLPALGVVAAGLVILFVWRYVRKSDHAGRISEFNEKTFKKLIETDEQELLPICQKCKITMRVEIKYRDFMKDTGDFLISKETAEHTTDSLVKTGRINEEDVTRIITFFESHPEIEQQMFKRYKCPNCSDTSVLPYHPELKTN
jgi:cytochrome c-type biogenesis protein CcmH/NrfF